MQAAVAKHYDRETAREAARREAHAQQARRYSGVSHGGLGPSPFVPRTERDLIAAATAAAEREAAHLASAHGQAMAQAASIKQRAYLLAQYADGIVSSLNRGDGSARQAVERFDALLADIKSDVGLLWCAAQDADLATEAA